MAKNNILTEIEEDLSRERMAQFFKKNGTLIGALLAILVIAIGGYEAWRYYDLSAREKAGDKLYAVISDFNEETDITPLKEVEKNSSFKEIVALIESSYYELKGDPEALQKTYQKLNSYKNADPALKELAELNLASIKLNKNPDDPSAEADLKKLTAESKVFRLTALEMLANYYKRSNRVEESKTAFRKIAEDENAPASLSGRAKSMLSSF